MPKGPPKFQQIDVPAMNALAQQLARQGYAWSDQDWAKRFPEFKAGREFAIDNANFNMAGGVDPLVSGSLKKTGLGGVDIGGNKFQQSRALGQPILAKEQRDRNYFEKLFSDPLNQPRGDLAGLSAKNIAEIRAANTGNKASFDLANFGSKVNAFNSALQSSQQSNAMIGQQLGGIAGSLAKSAIQYGQKPTSQSPYLSASNYISPSNYNYAPSGGYGNAGFASGSPYNYAPSNIGGTYEGTINNMPVLRAEPVNSSYQAPGSTGSGW